MITELFSLPPCVICYLFPFVGGGGGVGCGGGGGVGKSSGEIRH